MDLLWMEMNLTMMQYALSVVYYAQLTKMKKTYGSSVTSVFHGMISNAPS